MGAEQSKMTPRTTSFETSQISQLNQYNWIPSFQTLKNSYSPDRDTDSSPITGHDPIPSTTEYLDLRRNMPTIPEADQHCYQVVKAFCFALNYELVNSRKIKVFPPSYEYLKYFLAHSVGATQLHSFQHLSEVIKAFGICDTAGCRDDQQRADGPSDQLIESARKYRHVQLRIVASDLAETESTHVSYRTVIKQQLLAGQVVLFGMPWYSNFLKSREMPALSLPSPADFTVGGFCGVIVGFIEKDQQWIVATCFGTDWGDHGYIYVPYHVLSQVGAELVTLDLNEELIQLDLDTKRYLASGASRYQVTNHGWLGHATSHRATPENDTTDTCSMSRIAY